MKKKSKKVERVPLQPLFEQMFGMSKMEGMSENQREARIREIIAELRKNPNQVIDIAKYAGHGKKDNSTAPATS